MSRSQVLVGLGIAVATSIMVALWAYPVPSGLFKPPVDASAISRLEFVANWLLLPGFSLLSGIAVIGTLRFFVADAIDGSEASQNRVIQITLRYNRNTLEQTVLVVLAWLPLAFALPAERLTLIPELSILFLVARATFWLGYLIAPWARAVGFALTFYPTVGVYVWLALHAMQN